MNNYKYKKQQEKYQHIILNTNISYDLQLKQLYKEYPFYFSKALNYYNKILYLKNFILNNDVNKSFVFENQNFIIKAINSIKDLSNLTGNNVSKVKTLRIYEKIYNFNPIEKLKYLYTNFPTNYGQFIKNELFKDIKNYILEFNKNSIFENKNLSIQTMNVIQSIYKSKRHLYDLRHIEDKLNISQLSYLDQLKYLFKKYKNETCNIITKSYPKLLNWIEEQNPMLKDNFYTLSTKCFWILNSIKDFNDIRFLCKHDNNIIIKNKNVYSISRGYPKYCSATCRANDEEYKNTLKHSIQQKYNVDNVFKLNKIKQKVKNTMLKKYGVEYSAQNSQILKKQQQTKIKKYGNPIGNIEKMKLHFNDNLNKKLDKIFLKKYGVIRPLMNKEIFEKTIESSKKSKNGGTSNEEIKIFQMLIEKFGEKNIKFHYKSNIYPFYCDFYIENKNIYIEYNGFWMHGKHSFNINNKNDLIILNIWKNKSKNNKDIFSKAIQIWTITDPLKRNTAKNNNLNYVELWNLNQAKNWITNFK